MTPLAPFATRYACDGMVCSIDHLASSAGVSMLAGGGNAVDAAIATSAVLAVTSQHLCGLGGDLFALVHRPGDDRPAALNASGRAGSGADPARLRGEGHPRVPARGHVSAVTVPGCVDGWCELHRRFGSLPLDRILAPAIRHAADGFPASPGLAAAVRLLVELEVQEADDFTAAGRLRAGDLVRRPGVARTLEAVARGGRTAFYEGEFGEGLLALGAGEYVADDLATLQADWVGPLHADAWGHRLWTTPPNSQGYLTLAGAWMAARLDLPEPDDALWPHLLVEAARSAGHDRPAVLHEHADGCALLAPERLAPRLATIERDRAAPLGGRYEAGGTIFLCAADGDGTGVSLIQSNYSGFGSMLVVPGVRIFLHNRGHGFSLEPGHPAEYGAGRRPPHTLSPALVTRPDGALDCLLGTMGGDSQPQILLQLLARRYVGGQDPAVCVAAPRWVLAGSDLGYDVWQGPGVEVAVEAHAPAPWVPGLEERGHRVRTVPAWTAGVGHAHLLSLAGGVLAGASDPRAGGASTVAR